MPLIRVDMRQPNGREEYFIYPDRQEAQDAIEFYRTLTNAYKNASYIFSDDKVFDYGGDDWQEFIPRMRSGHLAEITGRMFFYWLEVLPPRYMNKTVKCCDGKERKVDFGFAEGYDRVTAFWQDGERYFCIRTDQWSKGE